MIQAAEESDVEEILSTDDDPSASSSCSVRDKKKRKKSNISFTVTSEQSGTSGVEIVDIEENSDDVLLIENAPQGKQKKIVLYPENENEDQEVIFQDFTRKKTNGMTLKRKSTKGMKKGTKVSEGSSVSQDIFIVEDVEDAEEDNYSGNSLVEGKKLFSWLINPVVPEVFFR